MNKAKSKVLVIALAISVFAVMSLGSLAWFTDSDSVKNDFLIAGSEDDPDEIFSVDVWEDDEAEDPDDDEKIQDGIKYEDILPGDDLYKEVNIENTGYYDQYVRATVTVTGASVWQQIFGEIYVPLEKIATDLNKDFDAYRLVYNADEDTFTYVLYYKDILKGNLDPNAVVTLFTNVAIPESMTRFQAADLSGEFSITVVADAIQTENVGADIYAAYETVGMAVEQGEFTVVETAKGLATILNSGLWSADALDKELDFTALLTNDANADVDLNLGDLTVDSKVYNTGKLDVTGGKIEIGTAGLENLGQATLKDVEMTAGSTIDYSNITRGDDATTTYDNVTVKSAGGGVAAADGAEVVFNSGSVEVDTKSTSGRYLFYAEGANTIITINGGDFADFTKTSQNQKRAYICAIDGATVYVNGGTFGKASTRSGYEAGIRVDNGGQVIITGGTFGFDPSAWVASGYVANYDATAKTWTVTAI